MLAAGQLRGDCRGRIAGAGRISSDPRAGKSGEVEQAIWTWPICEQMIGAVIYGLQFCGLSSLFVAGQIRKPPYL